MIHMKKILNSGDTYHADRNQLSNCGPRIELNTSPVFFISSIPLPPGPPGLKRTGPLYPGDDSASVDSFRMIAMTASAPCGSE